MKYPRIAANNVGIQRELRDHIPSVNRLQSHTRGITCRRSTDWLRGRRPRLLQLLAHRSGVALERLDGHVGTRHRLAVTAESMWLAGHAGREVNSFHGFGIRSCSWRVAARAADGSIEALEDPARRTLGIMWHPEREQPFADADVGLFREFFA